MIVYVEVIWLLNLLIDWMILLLTQSITKQTTKQYRLFLASFIGAIVIPLAFLFPSFNMQAWPLKVIHSLVIVYVAFGFANFVTYMRALLTFYFMTFAIGGGLLACHYLFATETMIPTSPTMEPTYINGLFVLIGFPVIALFTKIRMDKHQFHQLKANYIYQITISWKGKLASVHGYLDSGNHLSDPMTQTPVMICEQSVLHTWLTPTEIKRLESSSQQLINGEINHLALEDFRIIPYQGVSGQTDLMVVFKPDYIQIQTDHTMSTNRRVLIGIQFGEITSDGRYQCLLHPKLFDQVG
ncbi:stage II sporulation protein GA [Gracilibacillus halophilus YIM-C55.5]|uniref:Sporulation sigma-E factor-processing peptidase n=1 Tax=Gracilibacillus halophilus YIM-C55.5 TaxID=1308866 RepID=N4WQA8_9BACI|nr:sigma-E processing peptidase SpoIIGA [Gracilibacillus halophilus]ENH98322.1 stage II sporulation protein GA [Gracilibacillus halophilus YIM-C55.5]